MRSVQGGGTPDFHSANPCQSALLAVPHPVRFNVCPAPMKRGEEVKD